MWWLPPICSFQSLCNFAYISFYDYANISNNFVLTIFVDADGGPCLKSYFFCELKPHAKFPKTMITPSGREVTVGERETGERENKRP